MLTTRDRRNRGRWARVLAAALGTVVALGGPLAAARADGDPASDVLVAAPPIFLSADGGIGYATRAALVGQLGAAARDGHPLRVAVIAHRVDLGSVTALWGRPQTYAEFLGRELSLDYRGELLVVMPAGFGVTRDGRPLRTPLTGLAPRRGRLADATEQAIRRLTGVAAGGGRVAVAPAPSRAAGVGWWVTTAVALAAVLAAWVASLRRRPLRARPMPTPSAHQPPAP